MDDIYSIVSNIVVEIKILFFLSWWRVFTPFIALIKYNKLHKDTLIVPHIDRRKFNTILLDKGNENINVNNFNRVLFDKKL